jgi:hypothetical protein
MFFLEIKVTLYELGSHILCHKDFYIHQKKKKILLCRYFFFKLPKGNSVRFFNQIQVGFIKKDFNKK